ncbi:HNH endonuclease signature motif containing protein [Brevibacillus sp. FSL L8-0520]|uniref:HNH endonuclease n=1 Tax=Brevibacillus TaxID=55080 RepID=UPI0030CE024E
MKLFKKLLVPLLSLSLLLPTSYLSSTILAEENIDFENLPIQLAEGVSLEDLAEVLNEPRILQSKNVTVIDNEELSSLAINSGERKKVFGAKSEPDETPFDFVATTATTSDKRTMGQLPEFAAIAFDHYMTSDYPNGEVTSNVRVSAVLGSITSVAFRHEITRSVYERGSYRYENYKTARIPYPRVGRTEYVSANADTFWWSGDMSGTATTAQGGVVPINKINGPEKILTNRLGEIYPDYVDPQSNIELIKPDANLVKLTRDRSSNYRKNFEKHYESYYGKPQYFDWDDVEIHHMIPLEYYGTNDVDNLIPVYGRLKM